jgi:hypothetical protein
MNENKARAFLEKMCCAVCDRHADAKVVDRHFIDDSPVNFKEEDYKTAYADGS